MQIFLMWSTAAGVAVHETRAVEARLQRVFAPLFAAPPASRSFQSAAGALVALEIPINGWVPPHFESEGGAWALAPEYPVAARDALERRGLAVRDGRLLLTLAEQLDRDPEPLLRDIAPMFSLVWNRGEELRLQNDGLGQAQLFEYDDGRLHAVSNKIASFRALGVEPEPVAAEWAVRLTVDWFPGLMSGYRNIRCLAPATRLRLTAGGVEREGYDILGHWLRRDPALSREACLELAYEGFQRHLRAAARHWSAARCGLTGGYDSRAVASGLIREGLVDNVTFAVRGRHDSLDIEIARKLAKRAGIGLSVRRHAMRPPEEPAALRRNIERALLWQAGYIDVRQHASFMNGTDDLGGGDTNIMGQHGEIGRGFFATRIGGDLQRPGRFEDALLHFAVFENTPGHFIVRREHLPFIREAVAAAWRAADRYGLEGLDRLDFFYLFERTRRWASAGNHIQPGHIVTPFLIPEYIHAVYNYPAFERPGAPFHRFIVRRNLPDWAEVAYEKERRLRLLAKEGRVERRRHPLRWCRRRVLGWAETLARRYRPALLPRPASGYWQRVGRPLVDEITARDGFWSEVFDAGLARRIGFLANEQLVIAGLLPSLREDICR